MQNPELVDYIGVESSVDLKPDVVNHPGSVALGTGFRRRSMRSSELEKEYPPPIPWLARTENLPSHMPWVMKRYYTSDGRLIIKEEKVKRHEYFKADRSNGRLVLKLVPLGDAVDECWREIHAGDESGGDEGTDDPMVEEAFVERGMNDEDGGGGGRRVGVGVGVNPCGGFGMAVQAFPPPVHT